VVLVHGAFHGAWCFERVVPLLERAGVEAIAVELPGHGSSPLPYGDLHDDAGTVHDVLDTIAGEAILIGHSYGGAVITEAGVHSHVRELVYLCAFTIDAEESCNSVTVDFNARFPADGRPNLADGMSVQSDGTATLSAMAIQECFYNDCDEETVRWALRHVGAQSLTNLGQSPTSVAWNDRPSTYVLCTQDMAIHPMLQSVFAERCTRRREMQAGHSPFASKPAELSELLIDLARYGQKRIDGRVTE